VAFEHQRLNIRWHVTTPVPLRRPSLNGAFARLSRAAEHIRNLETSAVRAALSIPAGTTGEFTDVSVPPEELSILVGETVYNLRSALDYLVFELALLDSGQEQEKTQFPIESRADVRWKTGTHRMLTGLNSRHWQRILELQPFNGCSWTAELRDLSNPDKHRKLTFVQPFTARVSLNARREVATLRPGGATAAQLSASASPSLCFEDGTSVVSKLRSLEGHVDETLRVFAAEFPG
jgi:hypothetical protein